MRRERSVKRISISSAVVGLVLPFAHATADPLVSDPITVTATRFPTGLESAPVSVTVIDAQEISRSAARNLSELLKLQAGVQGLDLSGINGSQTRLDTGGFGATANQNTLVLLNGRRLNDVDLTGANLASIPLDSVARVEILHGSAAVAYGDNAVGGVINIVTKSGFEGPTANVTASAGSYRTNTLGATIRSSSAHTAAILTAQGLASDGYRDNSAFHNNNVLGEVTRLTGDTRYGLRAGANHQALQLPGALNEPVYLVNPRAATSLSERSYEDHQNVEGFVDGKRFAAELAVRSKNQKCLFYGATEADLDTVSFTPRYTCTLAGQQFVVGADLYRSTLSTQADFTGASNASDTRRNSLAAYLTDAIPLGGGFMVNVGARRQAVYLDMTNLDLLTGTASGDERDDWLTAWDATLSWQTRGVRIYARTAQSFRFPVLDEMWSYYSGTITPLRPQRGHHIELGAHQQHGGFSLDASAFHVKLTDEIGYNSATGSNENLDPTQHDGVNLGMGIALDERASARVGYTWRDTRFRAGAYDGNTIPEIPRHSLTVTTQWRVTEHQLLGLDGVYTGERYFGSDYANIGKQMSSHTIWNLHYTYAPPSWKLRVAFSNLTDETTADIGYYASWSPNPYFYYPLPDRMLTVTVEKNF